MISYKKIAITALLGLGLFATTASADADKGQRIYQKKLKSACKMTGAVFAAKHTQDEWAEFNDNDELGAEMTKICPAGKDFFESDKFLNKYSSHLYDFVNDFASDSGNIPSC